MITYMQLTKSIFIVLFLSFFNLGFCSCSKDEGNISGPKEEEPGPGDEEEPVTYKDEDLKDALHISLSDERYTASARANGFLFGITYDRPGDALLDPLSVSAYRSNFRADDEAFERMLAKGIQTEFIFNSYYDFPPWKNRPRPGINGDYSLWEEVVSDVVNTNLSKGRRGDEIQYDIWNEGDFHSYWDGSRADWLELWVRGAKVVRALDPAAKIIGPSFARFNLEGMIEFIEYADDHGVMPDVLAWHEVEADYSKIESHIEALRSSSVKDKLPARLQINEYGDKALIFTPGGIVNYIAPMDRAQIEAGLRGSFVDGAWGDYTLCGLLIDDEIDNKLIPTPAYWTHRYYATLARENNTMVKLNIDHPGIDALLSYNGSQEGYLLLGNAGEEDYQEPIVLEDFKRIAGFEPSEVEVVALPNHRNAFPDPAAVSTSNTLAVESGRIIFKANLPAKSALFVRFKK